MASRKKEEKRSSPLTIILLLIVVLLAFLWQRYGDKLGLPDIFGDVKKYPTQTVPVPEGDEALFHIIDVGQGDAILVTTTSGNMLIDTSEGGAEYELAAYLEAANITEFEYVIFTHPDYDHIGNSVYVIENYTIKNLIMTDCVADSKTYENMIDAIEKHDQINVIRAESGYEFVLGALHNVIIAPNDEYKDVNEMSIVIKSTFGDTSIMLTGDAETKSEADILDVWGESVLDCDVLKVGHHGSKTSTTEEFLEAVSPTIAVISCGEGNRYGHPHPETIERLEQKGITVYRTDIDGSVVLKTDGKTFTVVSPQK